ncbi:hypothetical protein [Cryobacterium luteum]|uniref:EamA-like transporter family protein n=1 Tax=Cryobacterium luteum TaxID=1424661 RepID=A0A5F0CZR7_9MICO|nr:hypothetical protein [Cryobacterium luteum]TFB84237.1 hypothetical protein E3O10_16365 [Cryobacterium luteum]
MAIGAMAQVSQVQRTQPTLHILWTALLLREELNWRTIIGGIAVILCAVITVRNTCIASGSPSAEDREVGPETVEAMPSTNRP